MVSYIMETDELLEFWEKNISETCHLAAVGEGYSSRKPKTSGYDYLAIA